MAEILNLNNSAFKTQEYYTQTRPEMMNFVPFGAKKVLDIGCGSALFSLQVKDRNNAEVWGIELDKEVAKVASVKIDRVLCGDAFSLLNELPDNYFDCIIFNDVLEHLDDPYSLLKQIKVKLSPNGVIVSSIPNVRFITNLYKLLIKKDWKYEDSGILDNTHLRFFTQKSIIQMYEEAGYKIEKIEGINPIKNWKFELINILSLGFFADTRYLQFASIACKK